MLSTLTCGVCRKTFDSIFALGGHSGWCRRGARERLLDEEKRRLDREAKRQKTVESVCQSEDFQDVEEWHDPPELTADEVQEEDQSMEVVSCTYLVILTYVFQYLHTRFYYI